MSKFLQRLILAVVMLTVVAAALYLNGWVLTGALAVLAVIAELEMSRAVSSKGDPVCKLLLMAFAALMPVGYFFKGFEGAAVVLAACVTCLFISSILIKKYTVESVIKGGFAFIYPQMLFLFFYAVTMRGDGKNLIAPDINRFIIIATAAISVMTDTFAYLIGSAIGKHKLCPEISPKKSVEGAIGGIIGGVIGAVVMIFFIDEAVPVWAYLVFAVMVSALSQIGDLSASIVKRKFEIKDYSRLLGEHGGIMDRLDSILFIMPYSYIFFIVICGL